ncbi:AraC family transcriptional regulator [Parazoarcus communis]|jgi:AraC-like DNA-binding protein|uniref:AraC family transcriptional regulator n=1 Tax=Parazoarcus communis TaxID=41977 RepID=A0A2U8GLF7_9RHOO|nr:AraC family transcriptional regulator [Parazoarcus communis]AWI74437.1 AraC family transcriptional regulator [Parazoarcus communis]
MNFDTLAPQPVPGELLSRYPVFHTDDMDEARRRGADVFCDHRLDFAGADRSFDARMCYRRLRGIGLGRMTYGGDVAIDPGQLDAFTLVQMPLSGHERIRCGNIAIDSCPGVASVVSPKRPVTMQHRAGTEKIFIRIDSGVLERHCIQHLGYELRDAIDFRVDMHLDSVAGQRWMRAVQWLFAEAEHDGGGEGAIALSSPLLAAQIEQMLISMLLMCQPNNYTDRFQDQPPSIAPAFVKRVEQYIEEHADEALTIVDLAEHVGVSSRSLFAGFRRFRDTTPMNYLKEVRLKRVHDALLHSWAGDTTVTREAMRWGFSHLGHFATAYKRRFGESPSDTLTRG